MFRMAAVLLPRLLRRPPRLAGLGDSLASRRRHGSPFDWNGLACSLRHSDRLGRRRNGCFLPGGRPSFGAVPDNIAIALSIVTSWARSWLASCLSRFRASFMADAVAGTSTNVNAWPAFAL